jgi:hypothetical protein
VRVFAGTNGLGAWEYTLTSRPESFAVHLPALIKDYQSPACASYETNDDLTTAHRLRAPGTYCSYIETESDLDYYRLDLQTTGPLTVELSHIPSGSDYDIVLYSQNGLQLEGSWWDSNQDEQIVFHPSQPGRYYLLVEPYKGYSQNQAYHLQVSYNGTPGAGQINGTVMEDGVPAAGVPILLYHSNGYRTTRVSTLTDNTGTYRFRGQPSLPIGHTYRIYYPNYERDDQRLAYRGCWSFTGYQAGESYESCSFDVSGIPLVAPPAGMTHTLPITFQWTARGFAADEYQVRLRRWDPSYVYYYSPVVTQSSYVLDSLPAGFNYGDSAWWSVHVNNSSGYGASYYVRSVILGESITATHAIKRDLVSDWNEPAGTKAVFPPDSCAKEPELCPLDLLDSTMPNLYRSRRETAPVKR